MFYRLYVTEFENSSGLKIYGGKRHSKYINPQMDPYVGSGTIIRKTISKYGPSCIKSIKWSKNFDTPELLKEAEEFLIDILKEEFKNCSNLVKGGFGGRSYYNPLDNPSIGQKRSLESKKRMSSSAKTRVWSEEGLKRRKESTSKMWTINKHPDFSGDKNPAARKVKVGDIIFSTGKECALHFGISQGAVIGRCKNTKPKWKEWTYVDL